jgi:hypothetical protein
MQELQVKTVDQMVEHYKSMRAQSYSTTMYEEVKWQYISMAQGGDGGPMGFADNSTCRSVNYPGYPDSFFREVCERMGWL